MDGGPVDLAFDQHRVQDPAGVVDSGVAEDLDVVSFSIDFDGDDVGREAVGGRRVDLVALVGGGDYRERVDAGILETRINLGRERSGVPVGDAGRMAEGE